MGLPIWIYDYKAKRYVVFPFHLLKTFPDGRRGIAYQSATKEQIALIEKHANLFRREERDGGLAGLIYDFNFVLKERRPVKDPKTGAKWYSKEYSQIKKYKHKR